MMSDLIIASFACVQSFDQPYNGGHSLHFRIEVKCNLNLYTVVLTFPPMTTNIPFSMSLSRGAYPLSGYYNSYTCNAKKGKVRATATIFSASLKALNLCS